MAYNDIKEIYKDFASDKPMKWIFRFMGVILVIIFLTVAIKGVMGKHVRFLGIEMNMPEENEKDLNASALNLKKTAKPLQDTISKIYLGKKNDNVSAKTPLVKNNFKKSTQKQAINDTNYKTQTPQQNSNSGTNNGIVGQKNVNYGTNNGVIGDNNNVFGKLKEHPSEQLLDQIEGVLLNKDEQINIMAVSTGAGSADFATELATMMRKRGYNKISVGVGQIAPIPKKGVTLDNMRGDQTLLVNID